MSVETKIVKLEKTLKIGFKPKLYGIPLEGCEWTEEDEAKLLAKAIKLGKDLARPIFGSGEMAAEVRRNNISAEYTT